ncbi:UDP-3-O-(3-hydroxymyristoyl)glucosamine N-acyltransferase [Aliarcobacter cryaerophilus]|uniref:UDP-3-O-(3-hydroxymyristoyl)glucosamine N-acyltransferase n=1 Tax=Aliarcobacter cryaerophilus TaxID=28198 RepID=UPI0008240DD9|nr:UDP-3-O-(3-hydroxymyristoyl)glucosamine N-acyltransferase [Aliarcobacter cryaerophilus]
MNKIDSSSIAIFLNTNLIGENIIIDDVVSLNNLKQNTLSFISKYGYEDDISKKALLIVDESFKIDKNSKNSYIRTKNPRLSFARVIEEFLYEKKSSFISDSSNIANNVKLGSNVYIGHNVTIENGCMIGDNTIIEHNVVILKNCTIGNNCKINPGVIIGDDGLGSLKDENGNLIMLRHLGKVIVEDFVEIGANTTIARGTLDNTIIKKYTKIGPQVNIGHNTFIDENCEIAGRTHTSGSVKIGKRCFLGANCSIKESIKIGDDCTVGIGSVVIKNVLNNTKVMGLEALNLRDIVKFKNKNNYKEEK